MLPFGVCNGGATFQRVMDYVLSGLSWKICLLYLDDIILFSKTFEEHIQNLSLVLTRLQKSVLKVAPKNDISFKQELNFLDTSSPRTASRKMSRRLNVLGNGHNPKMEKKSVNLWACARITVAYTPSPTYQEK